MIFAKIDYINLLPFYTFVKKNIKSSQIKSIINHKKSYPSLINKQYEKDSESSTSNILAQVLNLEGKIIIGDKALNHFHNCQDKDFIDLAKAWNEKYNLPPHPCTAQLLQYR